MTLKINQTSIAKELIFQIFKHHIFFRHSRMSVLLTASQDNFGTICDSFVSMQYHLFSVPEKELQSGETKARYFRKFLFSHATCMNPRVIEKR